MGRAGVGIYMKPGYGEYDSLFNEAVGSCFSFVSFPELGLNPNHGTSRKTE